MKEVRNKINTRTIILFVILGGIILLTYLPWFYIKTEKNHIPWVILLIVFISVFSFLFFSLKYKVKIIKSNFKSEFINPTPKGDIFFNIGNIDLDPIPLILSFIAWILASFLCEFVILVFFSGLTYLTGGLLIGINWIIFHIYKLLTNKMNGKVLDITSIIFFSFCYSLFVTTWLGILLVGPRYFL